MKPKPGTYALILQSHSNRTIRVGRRGQPSLQPGYYTYIGSAFGPGGVQTRVSRHLRVDKRMHWHIDYLREYVTPMEARVSYAADHLEHEWASILYKRPEMNSIQGFGCSDCKCQSHLFFTTERPEGFWLSKIEAFFG